MSFNFIPNSSVNVPDINYKDSVTLAADESAVLVVDMQNDFVKEKGNLVVPAAQQTIPQIQKLVQNARKAGVKVAYTQDTQVKNDPEFDIWPEHCLKDSWGWEIIEELKPQPDDLICPKNRYDGFYGSWLDHFLNNIWHVKNLVIVGTVSNICVLHTAASAAIRWFHVVIPARGISAMNEFDQALTLRQVDSLYAGDVVEDTGNIEFTS